MIAVIYGTTGELIKLAPVLARLRAAGLPFEQVTTAQQAEQIPRFLDGFGLPQPDTWLAHGIKGRDLRAQRDVPRWLVDVARRCAREAPGLTTTSRWPGNAHRPRTWRHNDDGLGALMGRTMRAEVAHIESGLRSFDLRHPFPEELNRRTVSRIAGIHYAPGPAAMANLQRHVAVDTGSNTVRDSLAMVPDDVALPFTPPNEPFGIVPACTGTSSSEAESSSRVLLPGWLTSRRGQSCSSSIIR